MIPKSKFLERIKEARQAKLFRLSKLKEDYLRYKLEELTRSSGDIISENNLKNENDENTHE